MSIPYVLIFRFYRDGRCFFSETGQSSPKSSGRNHSSKNTKQNKIIMEKWRRAEKKGGKYANWEIYFSITCVFTKNIIQYFITMMCVEKVSHFFILWFISRYCLYGCECVYRCTLSVCVFCFETHIDPCYGGLRTLSFNVYFNWLLCASFKYCSRILYIFLFYPFFILANIHYTICLLWKVFFF